MALKILTFLTLLVTAAAVTIPVARSDSNATSPYMYGLTLDGSNSLDGVFASSPPYTMRTDLLEKLKTLNPSFLRLPGGDHL
jgi:hypothetical protein